MFNISFSEVLFILILAFVVLGPEKLTKAAQTFGFVFKKIKSQYYNLQNELNSAIKDLNKQDK